MFFSHEINTFKFFQKNLTKLLNYSVQYMDFILFHNFFYSFAIIIHSVCFSHDSPFSLVSSIFPLFPFSTAAGYLTLLLYVN